MCGRDNDNETYHITIRSINATQAFLVRSMRPAFGEAFGPHSSGRQIWDQPNEHQGSIDTFPTTARAAGAHR